MSKTNYETHYMKIMVLLWSTIYETHYMKNKVLLWSTSVEKEIVALPFFLGLYLFFFWPFLFFFFIFFFLGNALIMMIITLFLQLDITTRYYNNKVWLYMNASGGVPACAMKQESHVWKLCMVALPQIRCQLHDHAKAIWQYDACHMNGTVESCMTIYLRMAMEMTW